MHEKVQIARLLSQELRDSAHRPENMHRRELSRNRRRFGRRKKF